MHPDYVEPTTISLNPDIQIISYITTAVTFESKNVNKPAVRTYLHTHLVYIRKSAPTRRRSRRSDGTEHTFTRFATHAQPHSHFHGRTVSGRDRDRVKY